MGGNMVILSLLVLWYITKVYYTRSFKFMVKRSGLIELRCFHCGTSIYRADDNLRIENYCQDCL